LKRGLRLVAAVAALGGSACAVGPDFVRPPTAPPEDYRGQVGATEAASIADLPWWEVFQDETLQQLVLDALASNYDLAAAVHRVEQAKSFVGVAQSPFYPQISYQGSAGRQGQPRFQGTPRDTFSFFDGAFALAWEIDVWGRIRRSSEAAQQSLLATEEFRRGVLLSLVTDVAQAYLGLLELDSELEITRETASAYQGTLDLFTRRFQGGVGNDLEVARAEGALAQTLAQIPDLERAIVAQENAIRVLLGREPGPIPRGTPLAEREAPPATPPGLPSALLERRPDVLQAEHVVASANAQVGVAVANFFPQIGLTALYGGQSSELKEIVKHGFSVWNAAGNAAGPIFQGFALLEQYRGQVAGWEETEARYEQTAIIAFSEVSDALTAQARLDEARAEQERAVLAYRKSVRLSLLRFDHGLSSYFEVLEAQKLLYPAELVLAKIQRDQLLTVVTLYRALGGGWNLPDEQWTQKP